MRHSASATLSISVSSVIMLNIDTIINVMTSVVMLNVVVMSVVAPLRKMTQHKFIPSRPFFELETF